MHVHKGHRPKLTESLKLLPIRTSWRDPEWTLLLKPSDLHDAIGMGKLVDNKLRASRSRVNWVSFHRPQIPLLTQQAHQLVPNPPTQRAWLLSIKHLTPIDMAARRKKRLCYNCDVKFTPGHRCKPAQFLCLLVDQEDSSSTEDEPSLDLPSP